MNKTDQWTIIKLIQWTTEYFKSYNVEDPRLSAEILLAHALELRRLDLYLKYDQPLNTSELKVFKSLIKRRVQKEPVAYITGRREFWSMDFEVNNHVLIPRPDTECLVETAINLIYDRPSQLRILELGVGSGAITLAIACEHSENHFFATDYSYEAIKLARKNAQNHKLDHIVTFLTGSWYEPFKNKPCFDIILSNPPYIKSSEINKLQPEICNYEPRRALDGGPDGLDCLRHIIEEAHNYLAPGGSILVEIGFDQKKAVQEIAEKSGLYKNIICKKDYSGLDRVISIS
ncbi:Release factor glutamine methyltransferase [Candidatus Magnetomoraceae bacterium gMMP-15]